MLLKEFNFLNEDIVKTDKLLNQLRGVLDKLDKVEMLDPDAYEESEIIELADAALSDLEDIGTELKVSGSQELGSRIISMSQSALDSGRFNEYKRAVYDAIKLIQTYK